MRVYVYQPGPLDPEHQKRCWVFPGIVNPDNGDWCHYPSLRYIERSNWSEGDMRIARGVLQCDEDLLMDEGL